MFKHRTASILVLLSAFAANAAHAFFDPPWITPAVPRTGEIVSLNIRGGICDAIFFRPGYPQITRTGNEIRILEYGHHWDTFDLCVYDIGTLTEPIGAFSAGYYTLTVDFTYDDPLYGPTVTTLGVVPFAVLGTASTVPVPTLDHWGVFASALLISSCALRALRPRRRRSRC